MTLSKKHFIAIAKILAEHKADNSLINDFCYYFKSENSQFDRYTFHSFIEKEINKTTEKEI